MKRNKINVESGEDVFRFHLIPSFNSDLPKITTSVLKTRSTLSLHKVYKYLVKKLSEIDPTIQTGPNQSEMDIVLLTCNGQQLDTTL